ncbi:MAG: LPS export ABC transporter permease LptG [Gammaproteobacteria bacterium]|nr:LPS export ABC transporter permease LptG [Gammaproteobacteria bacterium]
MQILNRYIAKNILISVLIVMTVMLSLFVFFTFLEELKDVGKGRYDTVKALTFVLMTLPNMAYQLMPIVALLGSTIGLGILASNSELTAIRSAGVSMEQIIWSVLRIGLVVILVGVVVGEWLAPISEQKAQTMRSVAQSDHLSLESSRGLWAKDKFQYINIQTILPGRRLNDIYIYELDHEHHMTHILHAKSAYYRDDKWVLENVNHSYLVKGNVIAHHEKQHLWDTNLSPDLFNVVTVKPYALSVWGLYQYIDYLEKNGLSADKYKQSLWTKATLPVVTAVMILLSIPFVFGPLRSVGIGSRILVGVLVGIGYHLFGQMFSYVGLVFKLDPAFTSLLPMMLAILLVVILLRRVY